MAGKAYAEKSVTFKSIAITGVQDVQENDTAESIEKHRADTSVATEAVFIDGVGAQIVVTTTDLSVRGTSGWGLGANGSLVIVSQQRAQGTGAVAAADKTRTYAAAVLVAISAGSPIQGRGTLQMTFEATDSTGASVVTHS